MYLLYFLSSLKSSHYFINKNLSSYLVRRQSLAHVLFQTTMNLVVIASSENSLQLLKKIFQRRAVPTKKMKNKVIEKPSYRNPEFQVFFCH